MLRSKQALAGWAANYGHWFMPYLGTTALYVGLALPVHALAALMQRARPSTADARR